VYSNFTIEFNILAILNISRLLVLRTRLMLNSGSFNLFVQSVIFVMLITLCPRSLRQFTISVVGVKWLRWRSTRNGGDKSGILVWLLLDKT